MKKADVNYSIVVALTLIAIADISGRTWGVYDGSALVATIVGGLIYALRGRSAD